MSRTKRIAMISYHTCPLAYHEGKESGGMEIYVLELAKELSNRGVLVDVFTRLQDEKDAHIVQVQPHFRVIHLNAGPSSHVPKKELVRYIPEFAKKLHAFITKENSTYDLVHAHYYMSGLAALELQNAYKNRFPLITTFHTLALMKNLVARNEKERESDFRINTEMKLIQRSEKITASSVTDRDYLLSLYDCPPQKIEVITPGVDTKLFHRIDKKEAAKHINESPKQKIIMFVGRIEPLKGIDVLMYALKIYLHRNPKSDLKLMIVGGSNQALATNDELERLKILQHTLHIHPAVEFIPQKQQIELPYYYNYADIVIIPSHYESFGMTALEAMACGTSIIVTDTTGISSIIDKELRNLLISANNPLMLATQIESVLNDQKKHEELQRKVMNKVKCMTWEQVANKMIRIYTALRKLIGKKVCDKKTDYLF